MHLYKHQVEYYKKAVYEILEKDNGIILPKFEDKEKNLRQERWKGQKRQKRQIISALISVFIGLAYEGISSFFTPQTRKGIVTGYAFSE